tara:strand:+ start:2542 stop:4311 length:1770 start_codon:yes stop_codon:yes gene_type:complete
MRQEFHSKPVGEIYPTEWTPPTMENMRLMGIFDDCLYRASKWNNSPYDDTKRTEEKGINYLAEETDVNYIHTYGHNKDDAFWNNREYYEPLVFCHKDDNINHPKRIWILGYVITRNVGIDYTKHDDKQVPTSENINLDNYESRLKEFIPKGNYLTDLGKLLYFTYRPIKDGKVSEQKKMIKYGEKDHLQLLCNALKRNDEIIGDKLIIAEKIPSKVKEVAKTNPSYHVLKMKKRNPLRKMERTNPHYEAIAIEYFNQRQKVHLEIIGDYAERDNPPDIAFQTNLPFLTEADISNIEKMNINLFVTNIFQVNEKLKFYSILSWLRMTKKGGGKAVVWDVNTICKLVRNFYKEMGALILRNIKELENLMCDIENMELEKDEFEDSIVHAKVFEEVLHHLYSFFIIEQLNLHLYFKRYKIQELTKAVINKLNKKKWASKLHVSSGQMQKYVNKEILKRMEDSLHNILDHVDYKMVTRFSEIYVRSPIFLKYPIGKYNRNRMFLGLLPQSSVEKGLVGIIDHHGDVEKVMMNYYFVYKNLKDLTLVFVDFDEMQNPSRQQSRIPFYHDISLEKITNKSMRRFIKRFIPVRIKV